MSFNPPPPFDPCNQDDYAGWYDMINSIVGFVTASTHLASTLRNNRCCFPETIEITEIFGEDESDNDQVFNITDFPWFLNELNKVQDVEDTKPPPRYHVAKTIPLIQFPQYDIMHGEPNREPRTFTLVDTSDFGDIYSGPRNICQSHSPSTLNSISATIKRTESPKSQPSNQSCFFEEYTDSEQTIDSCNLQENYEKTEEIHLNVNTSSNLDHMSTDKMSGFTQNSVIDPPHTEEEEQLCTIYDNAKLLPVTQQPLILECNVEDIIIVENKYPENRKNVENKEEGVATNNDFSDMDSIEDAADIMPNKSPLTIPKVTKDIRNYVIKSNVEISDPVKKAPLEINFKSENQRESFLANRDLIQKADEIACNAEKKVTVKSQSHIMDSIVEDTKQSNSGESYLAYKMENTFYKEFNRTMGKVTLRQMPLENKQKSEDQREGFVANRSLIQKVGEVGCNADKIITITNQSFITNNIAEDNKYGNSGESDSACNIENTIYRKFDHSIKEVTAGRNMDNRYNKNKSMPHCNLPENLNCDIIEVQYCKTSSNKVRKGREADAQKTLSTNKPAYNKCAIAKSNSLEKINSDSFDTGYFITSSNNKKQKNTDTKKLLSTGKHEDKRSPSKQTKNRANSINPSPRKNDTILNEDSGNEPVDFITKNIVNCLNMKKKLKEDSPNKEKPVSSTGTKSPSRACKEKINDIKTALRPNTVSQDKAKIIGVRKTTDKKSLSADAVKTLTSSKNTVQQKVHSGAKKPVAKTASYKDKPSTPHEPIRCNKTLENPTEIKSCLKSVNRKNNGYQKTCIIKEECTSFYSKRPCTVAASTDLRILPKLPLIRDTTLKLTAAETVKRASELLRTAEEKVLRPTTAVKMEVVSGFMRTLSSGKKKR